MRYHYVSDSERCRCWNGSGDVRSYQPKKGWKATADLVDIHPINGRPLRQSQWWIFERKGRAIQ